MRDTVCRRLMRDFRHAFGRQPTAAALEQLVSCAPPAVGVPDGWYADRERVLLAWGKPDLALLLVPRERLAVLEWAGEPEGGYCAFRWRQPDEVCRLLDAAARVAGWNGRRAYSVPTRLDRDDRLVRHVLGHVEGGEDEGETSVQYVVDIDRDEPGWSRLALQTLAERLGIAGTPHVEIVDGLLGGEQLPRPARVAVDDQGAVHLHWETIDGHAALCLDAERRLRVMVAAGSRLETLLEPWSGRVPDMLRRAIEGRLDDGGERVLH